MTNACALTIATTVLYSTGHWIGGTALITIVVLRFFLYCIEEAGKTSLGG